MRYIGLFFLLFASLLHAEKTTPAQQIPTEGLVPLNQGPAIQFAFLCLNDDKVADSEALKKSLVKWFKLKSADEIRRFTYKPELRAFSFGIGRSRFSASQELLPIPEGDILYAANNSLHWPGADKEILKHKTHYMLTCTSIHRTPWHAALDLSHALAAFTETHNTTGIYWGDASIIHSPSSFVKQANYYVGDAGDTPANLWVSTLFETTKDGGWNLFTAGFTPLDLREIEIHGSQRKRSELFAVLSEVKRAILSGKTKLSAGTTFTTAKGDNWKVSEGKSIIGREAPVWLLEATE